MPFLAPAMDGDRHSKQLQYNDMISVEGAGGKCSPDGPPCTRREALRSATAAPAWCISATSATRAGNREAVQVCPEGGASPEERSPG